MYRIIVILIIATARWAEEALEKFQSVQNIAAARVALPTRKLDKKSKSVYGLIMAEVY